MVEGRNGARERGGEGPQEGAKITVSQLRGYSRVYLATPYAKYPKGQREAWVEACEVTASLLKEGVKAFSPIAHGHPVAYYGGLDRSLFGHAFWMEFDRALMEVSDVVVVAMLPEWQTSAGITEEIKVFLEAGKPVIYLNPLTMALSLTPDV